MQGRGDPWVSCYKRGMELLRSLLPLGLAAFVGCAGPDAKPVGPGSGSPAASAVHERPNIVLLYADDAGWVDFGFQDPAAPDLASLTPNIDRIASEGVVCSRAYMSGVVCSPSRAGMLTGRYQQRFGHENNIPPGYMDGGMDLEQRTIADRLGDLGYTTGLVGKWHLGYPRGYRPRSRGFDEFYGLLQGSRSYHPIPNVTPNRVIQRNGEPLPEEGYVTDRFGDAACDFIRENRDRPFFLFVSFTAPHGPMHPRKSDEAMLAELDIDSPRRRRYVGMVHAMDQNVGRIIEALQANGLDENTLVIFTNDNGGQALTGASNGPLRGNKSTVYEGGTRVPMAFRWPGRLTAGERIDTPVSSLDFMPTFVTISGGDLGEAPHDGRDLMPLLSGSGGFDADRPLFWRHAGPEGEVAMLEDPWKLVWRRRRDQPPALYDLSRDPGESTDLAGTEPERLAAMLEALAQWESELETPRWGPGSEAAAE